MPLSQSALSQHLARLRDAGIVATRRQGQAVAYRLLDREILTLVDGLLRLVDQRENSSHAVLLRSPHPAAPDRLRLWGGSDRQATRQGRAPGRRKGP
ncbi:MAG: ArsR family transcriptional regulator [Phenylobacterium sp.]|nr:ArsR family transcriptional regulator [Phenylobacterium sp.]